jgi:hypothetical protein
MATIRIAEGDDLRHILEFLGALDDVRWQQSANYNLLNWCRDDLSADEKLLTHWLCYITDRQMPFERIWDVGGYVLSHLVHGYTADRDRSVQDTFDEHCNASSGGVQLRCRRDGPNKVLARYGIHGDTVPFASRYMPADAVMIYRTLAILDAHYGRSFAQFLSRTMCDTADMADAIRRTAGALDQLTYAHAGAVSLPQFPQRVRAVADEARSFRLDPAHRAKTSGRKRLWCSLRDYLRSPVFNDDLVAALQGLGLRDAQEWRRTDPRLIEALTALELPGDVWNNSSVFREGLIAPFVAGVPKSWDMPRTVRAVFDELTRQGPLQFRPEQFDVTFDFVPRMCERRLCDVCPFGAVGVGALCHRQAGVQCPVTLVTCGYRHRCKPDGCCFRPGDVTGLCRSREFGELRPRATGA